MSEATPVWRPRFGALMDARYADEVASFVGFLRRFDLNHVELRAGYLDVQPGERDTERLRAVTEEFSVSYTVHGPHLDVAPGNVNERLRNAAVAATKEAIELAAAIDASGAIVHGGSVRTRYLDHVREHTREQAVRALRECAELAAEVGVLVCLENQRDKPGTRRHTTTPDRFAASPDDVGVDDEFLKLTLDMGHAKATGVDYERLVEWFGDHIQVAHLHDNGGIEDAHEPLPSFRPVAADIDAPYSVLETKSRVDVECCVSGTDA